MKALVIGGGGREHAIVDALSRSNKIDKIFAAPGNAGIALQAQCIDIKDNNIDALLDFARKEAIDLTIVGPEAPLAIGIVDKFQKEGLTIFGPSAAATQIESSKAFAKAIMQKYGIPTADYQRFDSYTETLEYVKEHSFPTVIKYDGLAAGKGVVIAQTLDEADEALRDMLVDDKYGRGSVVIEEFLQGPEFSLMCFVAGEKVEPMTIAQDHKRAFDGDKGPNTGGMGAYSPVPFISKEDIEWSVENIMRKAALAMVREGCPFYGVLYGGLMRTEAGIKVIEFNARFGDPETEVVLPRLRSDIADIFLAVARREEQLPALEWDERAAVGVVLASKGYPGSYAKGIEIKGLDDVDAKIYHMGTREEGDALVTAGGRVLFITSLADTFIDAQTYVNNQITKIKCDNLFHRNDIGWQAVEFLKNR